MEVRLCLSIGLFDIAPYIIIIVFFKLKLYRLVIIKMCVINFCSLYST